MASLSPLSHLILSRSDFIHLRITHFLILKSWHQQQPERYTHVWYSLRRGSHHFCVASLPSEMALLAFYVDALRNASTWIPKPPPEVLSILSVQQAPTPREPQFLWWTMREEWEGSAFQINFASLFCFLNKPIVSLHSCFESTDNLGNFPVSHSQIVPSNVALSYAATLSVYYWELCFLSINVLCALRLLAYISRDIGQRYTEAFAWRLVCKEFTGLGEIDWSVHFRAHFQQGSHYQPRNRKVLSMQLKEQVGFAQYRNKETMQETQCFFN